MLGSTLILTVAMIAQPPTADRSAPRPTTHPSKQWLVVTDPATNQPISILGWTGPDGRVQFDPQDYPQLASRPKSAPAPSTAYPPTGVVMEKIPAVSAGQVWRGGNIQASVGATTDTERPPDVFLTVIGTKEERRRAKAEFERNPEFDQLKASMGDRLAVHYYDPSAPMVKKIGLPDGGHPDIVIQDATGGEVHRWHNDYGVADGVVGAIRKLNPDYKPGGKSATEAEGPWIKAGVVGIGFMITISLFALSQNRGRRWKSQP